MAIFHLHVKNISRGEGRSVVAAAAYRAGETLPNEAEERLSAFGGRRDVLCSEIRLPNVAPAWAGDRARLWNAVEAVERRKDARLAKEIEVALPREIPLAGWLSLARAMADIYTRQGFVVDLAIHDDGTARNPHAHFLLTTRVLSAEGFGGKIREADGLKFVTEARAKWAALVNDALAGAGVGGSVDPRSHRAAGIETRPGEHRGPNRAERRAWREAMDKNQLDAARKDLLQTKSDIAHPFQHLRARGDWPPLSRQQPEGMTQIEQAEFQMFWDAVDARADMIGGIPVTKDETLPMPGPDRRPISQEQQREAQNAMINAVEAPARRYRDTIYAETVIASRTETATARRWQAKLDDRASKDTTPEDDRDNRWKRER